MRIGRQGIVVAGIIVVTAVVLLACADENKDDLTTTVPRTVAQPLPSPTDQVAQPSPSPADQEAGIKYVLPEPLSFDSIEQAQSAVPYPIRMPELLEKLRLQRVVVRATPTRDLGHDLVTVDITFTNADGRHINLALNNGPTIPWGENQPWDASLESSTPITVLGASAVTKTQRQDGEVRGYVYWMVGDVAYQLFYPGRTGSDLIPIAAQTTVDGDS